MHEYAYVYMHAYMYACVNYIYIHTYMHLFINVVHVWMNTYIQDSTKR